MVATISALIFLNNKPGFLPLAALSTTLVFTCASATLYLHEESQKADNRLQMLTYQTLTGLMGCLTVLTAFHAISIFA